MSENIDSVKAQSKSESLSHMSVLFYDLISSPLNILLASVCLFLIYKIFKLHTAKPEVFVPPPKKPKIKKRNLTLEELKEFNGLENKPIFVALNGNIYDVTGGSNFYGPGGPYGILAGRDATRSLATFSLDTIKEDYDDISDLNPSEMDQLNEWEMQFNSKYDVVGKLIRPGEPAEIIDTDEDETSTISESVTNKSKDE